MDMAPSIISPKAQGGNDMRFTDKLWAETADLQQRILCMPFNAELAQGTLPKDTFQGYIIQDAHFLEGFARALALAASRAPNPDTVAKLAGSASGAIAVERLLHGQYMQTFGISQSQFQQTPPSSACDHYICSLLASAAVDPFPVAVVSLLPCFWIYHRVGVHIHGNAASDHPYQAWIDTYASEEFEASVDAMLELTDDLAEAANPSVQARMRSAFARSTAHEWEFWHSAYEQQTWPRVFAEANEIAERARVIQ